MAQQLDLQHWWRWKWQRSHVFRPGLQMLNAWVSLVCVIFYVVSTYRNNLSWAARYTYLIASFTFSVELMGAWTASSRKLHFLFRVSTIVDIVTIMAGFLLFFGSSSVYNSINVLRALRLFQVIRFLNALSTIMVMALPGTVSPQQLQLYRKVVDLFLTLFSVIFIGGCFFYEIESSSGKQGSPSYLHQAWYWATVTITTIGYGDFYPTTPVSQCLFPLMIIIILIVVPNKISNMTDTLSVVNKYLRKSYKSHGFGEHVVLMGSINHVNAAAFIDEFFHTDRGIQTLNLVMMLSEPPGPALNMLITSHKAHMQITALQGSPYVTEDLTRAGLPDCLSVFVMCDKYASDPEAEDRATMLTVLALAQYMRQAAGMNGYGPGRVSAASSAEGAVHGNGSSWQNVVYEDMDNQSIPHIMAQFHLPESIHRTRQLLEQQSLHPSELGMLPVDNTFFPLYIGFVKHALLGASIHTPGILTLIGNLVTTCNVPPYEQMEGVGWMQEYLDGAGNELYEFSLPPELDGLTYRQATQIIFEQHGAVLLGVRHMADDGNSDTLSVSLAPFDDLTPLSHDTHVGYIIASEQELHVKPISQNIKVQAQAITGPEGQQLQRGIDTPKQNKSDESDGEKNPGGEGRKEGFWSNTVSSMLAGMLASCRGYRGTHLNPMLQLRAGVLKKISRQTNTAPFQQFWHPILGNAVGPAQARTGGERLRRMSLSMKDPLPSSEQMRWKESDKDFILVTGDSCFDHLDELLAALGCNATMQGEEQMAPGNHQHAGKEPASSNEQTNQELKKTSLQDQHGDNPGQHGGENGEVQEGSKREAIHRPAARYRSVQRSRVIIIDPSGLSESQASHIAEFQGVYHLRASPWLLTDLKKLNLPRGSTVRAVVLPNLDHLQEAEAGNKACTADAHSMRICTNIRQYCEYVGTDEAEIWTEAILPVNVSYLLPLCSVKGPYRSDTKARNCAYGPIRKRNQAGYQRPASGSTHQLESGGSSGHNDNLSSIHAVASEYEAGDMPITRRLSTAEKGQLSRVALRHQVTGQHPRYLLQRVSVSDAMRKYEQQQHQETMLQHIKRRLHWQHARELVARTCAMNPCLAPTFAPGHVYYGNLVDKIFCQMLFNPLLLQVLSRLLGLSNFEKPAGSEEEQGSPHKQNSSSQSKLPHSKGESTATGSVGENPERNDHACDSKKDDVTDVRQQLDDQPSHAGRKGTETRQSKTETESKGSKQANSADTAGRIYLLSIWELVHSLKEVDDSLKHVNWDALRGDEDGKNGKTAKSGIERPDLAFASLGVQTPSGKVVITPQVLLHKQQPTWCHLFMLCLRHEVLPVALLRRDLASEYPYIYTAPTSTIVLRPTDEVYFIASDKKLPSALK